MNPVELTETGIRFQGMGGLLLYVAALVGILYLFRCFMLLVAGKHRGDWVIQLLLWGGKIALILSAFGLIGCTSLERERLRTAADIERSRAIQFQSQSEAIAAVADAMRPNYWPLVIVVIVGGAVAGTWVYWRGRVAYVQAVSQEHRYRELQSHTNHIPLPVQRQAQLRGGFAEYDGQRWLIVDASGKVLARQVKQLEVRP